MPRTANANLSVTLTAQDQASPVINGAADAVTRMAQAEQAANTSTVTNGGKAVAALAAQENSWKNLGKGAKQGGEAVSKVGSVLNVVGSQLGGLGGEAAQAGGQIAGLAGSLGTSGPLAVGLVALTAVVAAGAQAWKAYRFEADQAKEVQGRLDAQIQRMGSEIADKARTRIASLTEQIKALKEEMSPGSGVREMQAAIRNLEKANRGRLDSGERKLNDDKLAALKQTLAVELELYAQRSLKKSQEEDLAAQEKARAAALASNAEAERMAAAAARRDYEDAKRLGQERNKIILDNQKAEEAALKDIAAKEDEALNGRIARIDEFSKARIDAIGKQQQFEEGVTLAQAANDEAESKQRIDNAVTVANTVGSVANSLASAIASKHREMTAEERATATAQIAIRTATAIAGAIAAGAGVAWPANLAAIASGVGAVVAAFAEIASFEKGGEVGGRTFSGDNDAVNVIAHRGEVILNPAQQAAVAKRMGGAGRDGGVNVTIQNQVVYPDTVGTAKLVRHQVIALERAQRRGQLRLAR